MKTATSPALCFDSAKSEPIAAIADKRWWEKNQYRMAGLMRTISRGALILSGLGVGTKPSLMRVTSGTLGLAAGVYLSAFGEKNEPKNADDPIEGTDKQKIHRANIGRIYYGIVAASGAALVASGVFSKPKLWTETLAGLWTMVWSAYAALVPEPKNTAPVFDPGADASAQGFASQETTKRNLEGYKNNPKKFASDMLQFGAGLAIADGVHRKDPWRVISGVTLGASNFLQRKMQDADFSSPAKGPAL